MLMEAESPDVVIAKRLLDQAKQAGFTFQRASLGEDAPLVGTGSTTTSSI